MENDEIVLKANIFKITFLVVWVIFSTICFALINWVILFFGFPIENWKMIPGFLFMYSVLFLAMYTSASIILTRPIKISIIDDCVSLKFVFKTLIFELDSIKGFSTSTAKGGRRNVDLLCLYIQDNEAFDFMNYDFKRDKLRNIFENLGLKYLGDEPYKFKYLGFIQRQYKYI